MIPGLDVSKWQGEIDWVKVTRAGARFTFIKATEGITHTDPQFLINWTAARAAGILRSAYHYFHPRLDARSQAQAFTRALAGDWGELPPAIDLECPELTGSPLLTALHTFLQELHALSGLQAIIYTSPGFWSSYINPVSPEWPVEYPLWIAHYGTAKPTIPYPWLTYTFWQHTDRAEVMGITRFPARRPRVDLDWFNGSPAELDALRIG